MAPHLTNLRILGRFKNTVTGKTVNVHKGTVKGRGTDVLFYLYRNKRQYISQADFYGTNIYKEVQF